MINHIITIIITLFLALVSNFNYLRSEVIITPEASSGFTTKNETRTSKFMVSTANPNASKAGFNIIKNGGNALDAAIASQLVLNIVEPQSSGIGGGAFIVFWDNQKKKLYTYDGRETAPKSADPYLFINKDGEIIKRSSATIGGKSVGVPGLIKVMELAHKKHGKLSWKKLFNPAITIANEGFRISPRLFKLLSLDKTLREIPDTSKYFYNNKDTPLPIGSILRNYPLAKTLKEISEIGATSFYNGQLAKDIIKKVHSTDKNPGSLTLNDLKSYKAFYRDPICGGYKEFIVCGPPPPSSGGIGVIQTLGILEKFNLSKMKPWSVEALNIFIEANRLMFSDRALYIADPDFFPVPTKELINKNYLRQRASLISINSKLPVTLPGKFKNFNLKKLSKGKNIELESTTHISIIDKEGNAISMTSSIEAAFGSHLMVNGFLLNNQLTDFSYKAIKEKKVVANQVVGGKRPRSSMAPIVILNKYNEIVALTGSAGGPSIIPLVTKSIIGLLDWGLTPQEAVNLPNVLVFGSNVFLEKDTFLAKQQKELELLGYKVKMIDFASGLHVIQKTEDGLLGGADPRREGTVLGD